MFFPADNLDREPPPAMPFAALSNSELGRYIDHYQRQADSGLSADGSPLPQRDLDVVQQELRGLRAERACRVKNLR